MISVKIRSFVSVNSILVQKAENDMRAQTLFLWPIGLLGFEVSEVWMAGWDVYGEVRSTRRFASLAR